MMVGPRRGATGERKEEGVGREVGTWGKKERPAVGDKEKKGKNKPLETKKLFVRLS